MNRIKLMLLILITFIVAGCETQITEETSWNQFNLKEEVMSTTDEYYSVVDDCLELSRTITRIYSQNGMLLSAKAYDSNCQLIDQIDMKYSSNNRIESATFMNTEIHGFASSITTYSKSGRKSDSKSYDEKGNLVQRIVLEKNKSGDRVKTVFYDPDNNVKNVNEFVYEDGELTTIIRKDIKNGHEKSYEITHDQQGNIIKEDGAADIGDTHVITREFDEQNNLLLEITEFGDYGEFYNRYEYEYDNYGNWTKRIDYDRNSKVQVVERKIEYYSR